MLHVDMIFNRNLLFKIVKVGKIYLYRKILCFKINSDEVSIRCEVHFLFISIYTFGMKSIVFIHTP